jgi:hypothetical protein
LTTIVVALSVSFNKRCQKGVLALLQPQSCALLQSESACTGVFNISILAGGGVSKGMIAVEHELQPAADSDFKGAMTGAY